MKISIQTKKQWEQYAQLEQLSGISLQTWIHYRWLQGVLGGWLWSSLLNLLCRELLYDQQVEYLERCWSDRSNSRTAIGRVCHQLKTLMMTVLLT